MTTKFKQPVEFLSKDTDLFFESEWYETMTADHFWLHWRFSVFCSQFEEISSNFPIIKPKILEVGGGHGMLRQQLEDKFGWEVDLTDLNVGALQMSPESYGRTLYYNILQKNDELKETYDIIFLYDVLEHIEDTSTFLEALKWHLKPDGLLFINVPAIQTFYSAFDKVLGHYRRYDKPMLTKQLSTNGFDIINLRYWGITLLPFLFARWIYMSKMPKKKEVQSSWARKGVTPPTQLLQKLFRVLMHFENMTIPRPPLGTSLMSAARKKSNNS